MQKHMPRISIRTSCKQAQMLLFLSYFWSLKHVNMTFLRVNPVVGCVEPERPSPFAGMTEEQKEHEAVKLANLIHDLNEMGVVKPAIPGPDGRPREVSHVLEMRDAAAAANRANQESDSD